MVSKYKYGLLAATALLAAGTFTTVTVTPAQARDRISLSFSIGDVAFGYRDGYYDRYRRWHRWESDDEREWYRDHYGPTYYEVYRDNDRDPYRTDWRYNRRDDWRYGGDNRGGFAIVLGNVAIGYYDGYFDNRRRWHRWNSISEREWWRLNRRDAYFHIRRARDRDRYRREWWLGRRDDWRYNSYNGGYGGYGGGSDFAIVLGNVVFAYNDGYFDNRRRWHTWRSDEEREWYRRHYSRTYYDYRRDRDEDRWRRDWREGRGNDWRRHDDDDDNNDDDHDRY